jgi:hypothetical protein
MKRSVSVLVVLVAAVTLAAVVLVLGSHAADPSRSSVRLVHAVPIQIPGGIDVWVDGEEVASDVTYKTVTPYVDLEAGVHTVEVRAFLPDPLLSTTVELTGGIDVTVVGVGRNLFDVTTTVLLDDNSPFNANAVRLVNLSPDTSAIDVVITGTAVVTTTGNVPYKGASPYVGGIGAGLTTFEVRPVGQIAPLLSFTATLDADTINTFFVMGFSQPSAGQPLWEAVHAVDRRFHFVYVPLVLREEQPAGY